MKTAPVKAATAHMTTPMQTGALRLSPNKTREYAVYRTSDFAMIQIRKVVGARNRQAEEEIEIKQNFAKSSHTADAAAVSWSSTR
jgi:hypothetical protein